MRQGVRPGPAQRYAWDEAGDHIPPRGYELHPPVKPSDVKNSTEDIQLFTILSAVLARGAFPDGTNRVIDGPDALVERFRALSPAFFDASGNRRTGSGEHVVVLRPTPRLEGVVIYPDAVIDVYTRKGGEWVRIHSRPVVQTMRPNDWGGTE